MDLVRLLLCLLPGSRLKNRLLSMTPGWSLHPTAHLSPCLVWRVGRFEMGAQSRTGPGNVFRDVSVVHLGDDAEMGQFNWITAAVKFVPSAADPALRGRFVLESAASFTSRHYVDASGGVVFEPFSVIGGLRSTILTHSLDVHEHRQALAPIRVSTRSIVFTNTVILPGVTIAPHVVVAAGSVLSVDLDESYSLYGGSPARRIKSIADAAFFTRTERRSISRDDERRLMADLRAAEASRVRS